MKHPIKHYQTLVFDCDGVVLDSNKVKTRAFYLATLPYGEEAAQAMVAYHIANGGISRYRKFAYFLEEIITAAPLKNELQTLLDTYAMHAHEGLLNCEVARGLHELRRQTPDARWLIVSGGDQAELNEVFAMRGLVGLFDGGIFGSPNSKDEILSRECGNGNILQPAIFLGDSLYDYQAASRAGLDFVFMSDWSEVDNWKNWCQKQQIRHMANIAMLMVPMAVAD